LLEHFKHDRDLYSISPDDASCWRDRLSKEGLKDASVKTHIGNAKTIFAEAVRREVIAKSPFEHLKGGVTPTRNSRYVTPEEMERVLQACPDSEWRLLFGLARYAGLRTPSETHLITVADVDFDGAKLRVRSPKTERYDGHEQRIVPICPRLMSLIRERFEAMAEGEAYLVTIKGAGGRRRRVLAILAAAKVSPWDDTWQTLRRSCEIEWAQSYPQYAVSRWIGHSITVSGRHYVNSIPDELFAKVASGGGGEAAQNSAHDTDKATQKAAQHVRESLRTNAAKVPKNAGKTRDDATCAHRCRMEPGGIEPPSRDSQHVASTRVSDGLILIPRAAISSIPRDPAPGVVSL
jgi:integrase